MSDERRKPQRHKEHKEQKFILSVAEREDIDNLCPERAAECSQGLSAQHDTPGKILISIAPRRVAAKAYINGFSNGMPSDPSGRYDLFIITRGIVLRTQPLATLCCPFRAKIYFLFYLP